MLLVPVLMLVAGGSYLAWTAAQPAKAHAQPLPKHEFGPGTADPHPAVRMRRNDPVPAVPPDHLIIPALGISAALEPGAIHDHLLDLPADVRQVAQWTGGAALDPEQGTTLIAGHVDNIHQGEGALWALHTAQPGERITVTDRSGKSTHWTVTGLRSVLRSQLPQGIFTPTGPRRLIVITCGGTLVHDPDGNYYQDNVILTALPS